MLTAIQVANLELHYKTKLLSPIPDEQGCQESFAVQCESVDNVEPRLSRFLLRNQDQENRKQYKDVYFTAMETVRDL